MLVWALGGATAFLTLRYRQPAGTGSSTDANLAAEAAEPALRFSEADLEWDERQAPNYYLVVGPARINELPEVGTVAYSALDDLGRAGAVRACVDARLSEQGTARERKDVSGIHPSGWGDNEKVAIELPTGDIYHGYFWNRSHLLAKSLGGDEVIENLVCGTRMQNVGANYEGTEGGMAYTESLARDWLDHNPDGYVYYAAEPIYWQNEPVCRAVVVDVRSSDKSLDCEVLIYNAAKGYEINYATGAFERKPSESL